MRIEPELLDHPKYLRLKRRVGDQALEMLIRLWGHCQMSQRGGTWRLADAEYVEIVAGWKGAPGELYDALKELRLIEERGGAVVIHDWDKFNSRAVANWINGRLGGKPKEGTGLTQSPAQLMLGKPKRNPKLTQTGTGLTLMSEGVSEGSTEGDKKMGNGLAGSPGTAVAASRTQFAALRARIKELESQGEDLGVDGRLELLQKQTQLQELTRKQAKGDFTAV